MFEHLKKVATNNYARSEVMMKNTTNHDMSTMINNSVIHYYLFTVLFMAAGLPL